MQAPSNHRSRLHPLLATALAVAAIAVLVVAFTGCGGSDSSTTSGSTSGGSGSSATSSSGKIDISNFEFAPKSVTVKAGTAVTWTNQDSSAHTATATSPGGGFDTGTLQQGDSKTLKVEPGTYQYICSIHPFMKGTLTVK